jgi:hypothetical protein
VVTGRAISGVTIEKVSARTRRIRFTVTPISIGLGPALFPVVVLIESAQGQKRSHVAATLYLDSLISLLGISFQ